MKISFRILMINFAIVAIILVSSAIAYYSIMYNVLSSQQSKYLLNSANEFVYAFRGMMQDTEDEFNYLANNNGLTETFNHSPIKEKNIDFILETGNNDSTLIVSKVYKDDVFLPKSIITIQDFIKNNPFAVIERARLKGGKTYYYGRILSNNFLNTLSSKINAELALVWKGSPSEISNELINQNLLSVLNNAYKNLSSKNNFDIYSSQNESADILATIYRPSFNFSPGNQLQFVIFTPLSEATDLRTSVKYILGIIGLAGLILSLILTLVFTDKIRKQITQLSNATKTIKDGNFQNKINIKSKDELGELAGAFNTMLDELQKNEKSKNEYSEFITLINQNPTLDEISDAVLKKIIKTCGFTIGALYTVDENKLNLVSSYGLNGELTFNEKADVLESVLRNHETIEISSKESLPVISAGVISLEIKNVLIQPIIYNNKVIAILELGSFDKQSDEAKEYLSKIKEQLAIGLTNALALVQLENLVAELKNLNNDYQKQNIQIRKQNETLLELHSQLKEKADELEIQKEKAEEATRLKSNFLASMSHELRTPMNSILGLTELILEDKTLRGKNRERIEVVLKSGRRLMSLINDILDLSKIEAGKMEIHNEEMPLDEMLKDLENSIYPLATQKEISFKILRDINTKIIISTDRNKVTQVLINLLGNAVKFTENGYVELHISSIDNKQLKFEVIDSGIGISERDQAIIFEEFRQIDASSTRKYNGTGLGLAICKKIAEMLRGNLTIKSELGKGSTFTFTIPLNFVKISQVSRGPKVNIQTLIKNHQNPILIIDDDPEVRYTIGQYLITKGYEVAYAANGDEGIQKAIKLQPFAITLDVMMPNKDGWVVLRELKNEPKTKDIPVILISIIGDKKLGLGLGAFEYFIKPISPDKLLSAFERLESLAQKKVEKIVIVDDDELEFEKFKNAFKDDNIRIEYIKDSELAFSKILEVQPDLIILDLIMPNVDGITLSYKLKSNRDTKHIPIIISTAKDLTEEERSSLSNIVEEITVKSKGHPLDVLKIVRERIKQQEENKIKQETIEELDDQINVLEQSIDELKNKAYHGDVLIVDDDADTLFTINEIVQACDCKTTLAKSGAECLKALEQSIPDLILLDIMMPEMDGFQTLNKIRQNSDWAQIPVFAVTAKAMLGDKAVILRNGFNDYIAKPVNSGVLAFKIERLFSKLKIS
jgi:signal transduction histidine kinase/CheY-like chemotaxis protein/HAMP domain-containing protein